MSKLIVTGGAGFIGSHITDKLIELGHEVMVVDNLLLGKKENLNPKAKFFEVDIRDLSKLKEIFKDAEAVFHLAADPRLPMSIDDPIETHSINVTGTLSVLVAAKDIGVKKVILSSTCAVYGDQKIPLKEKYTPSPMSPYGLHKLMGEQYCRLFSLLFGLSSVCLRYANVYGPRKTNDGGYPMVIPIFIRQKLENKPMTVTGDGKATRDYVYVTDVVRANIKAWQSDVKDGSVFNIGFGKETNVNQIVSLLGGRSVNIAPRPGEMRRVKMDISLAEKELGWTPEVKFEEGLILTKKYWGVDV